MLVYSVNDDPTSVLMCTRTHVVHAGDSELTWLRTGISPPVPVAVRVQHEQCSECKITSFGVPSREVFKVKEALAALSDGGAFWTGEYPVSMLVHTAAGELFELSPRPMTRERCVQRIIRRTCSTLVSAGAQRVGAPELVCADAGPETVVCDETQSRSVNWGPLLEVSSLACEWFYADQPYCAFETPAVPLEAGKPAYPLLECKIDRYVRDQYECRVVIGPGL